MSKIRCSPKTSASSTTRRRPKKKSAEPKRLTLGDYNRSWEVAMGVLGVVLADARGDDPNLAKYASEVIARAEVRAEEARVRRFIASIC